MATTQWENYVKWTSPRGRWQLGISSEDDFGHLKQGNFVQRLWQWQSAYALNPNLVQTSFIQYDTESHTVGSNTRFRWTFKPGNDFFIVWNRGWKHLILNPHELSPIAETESASGEAPIDRSAVIPSNDRNASVRM
jgi:hypothetical protein